VAGRGEAAGVSDGTPVGGRAARHVPRHSPTTHDVAISRATDREVGVVAAVLVAGSEKAAAHRLGLAHSTVKHHLANARSKVGATTTAQLVWILAPRLPEPEGRAQADE
jgi:DNA-binding NarL/FixJ family response regulator